MNYIEVILSSKQRKGILVMVILGILLTIFFGSARLLRIITSSLEMIGFGLLFKKCGARWWEALIPFWRSYTLARCGNCESEGRVVFFCDLLSTVFNIALLFINENSGLALLFLALILSFTVIILVYMIRISLGLCEVFGRRKLWWFPWTFFTFIPALIWGLFRSFRPMWQVGEFRDSALSTFSNTHIDSMDKGLTVNLEERTVSDFFKKRYLLRDIHMYIQPGHMVLLLGGSGAGKSTLVNAINGYEPAKGEMSLDGENIYKEYSKMMYEIGFVPQQDLMRGNDTVLNTMNDAAALRLPLALTGEDRKKRVHEVMEIFGLLPVQHNLVEKLSGGQRKRLSIAMEFLPNPSLFILDEPDSGLDGVMARELMEQLRAIADQGKIVIVITHTPDRVIDLFDDVIVLAKDTARTGRLAYFGSIAEAKTFFGKDSMEKIVRSITREEEGGEGRADEFIGRFAEVQHA